ncbi:glycosyltransferase family 4 protein [Rhodothermus profundi]|uniref:Glycosyltransferase involved in cell wall bisynthesis n=1 Tax=Rhodothermus profundi TaxID=633813 RepID=A0A1M6Q897_9BACT|nr:glycosyltransferase family 4 protein [Rhodothermus profundi]SHK16378.1 Glycosyltransferase involved in cell wall bisynthesis [Rhodothermus profundi]
MRYVLLVTYYFPPAGGAAVQRFLKFARYLPAYDWRPVVLTVRSEDAAYPFRDEALEAEVPVEVPVFRTRTWDPYAAYARWLGQRKEEAVSVGFAGRPHQRWKERLARWIRANLFLPDARVGWVPFALRALPRLLRQYPIEAIVTTGPPHSTHLIGYRAQRRYRLPWVADLRDPWTDVYYYEMLPMTRWARRLDAWMERRVLAQAQARVVVTPTMQRTLQTKGLSAVCIPNGYDPADFEASPPRATHDFWITYAGSMGPTANPEGLWKALVQLRASGLPIRVRLIGLIDASVRQALMRHHLAEQVALLPFMPRRQVLPYLRESALLLLVINRTAGNAGIVTSKLYEYLGSGRPVLGIGPVQGDAAAVLQETKAGKMFDYDDVEGIAAYLRRHYEAWAAGRPLPGALPTLAQRYSRPYLAGELAHLLEEVTRSVPCESAAS